MTHSFSKLIMFEDVFMRFIDLSFLTSIHISAVISTLAYLSPQPIFLLQFFCPSSTHLFWSPGPRGLEEIIQSFIKQAKIIDVFRNDFK